MKTSRPTRAAPADTESALRELGIEIVGGDEYEIKGRCPMHLERTGKEDRHPSWSVNRSSGLWGCWSCGASGNFLALVMYVLDLDAWKAGKWIKNLGVSFDAVIDSLRITYDEPQELDLKGRYASYVAPPSWALKARSLSLDSCAHYGVRWNEREDQWIIPIRSLENELIGWQIVGERDRFFRNFPVGVKKGQCVFGLEIFPVNKPAVVVESPLDVARFHTAGYEGGVATYGARWTNAQIRAITEVASEIIACFDHDEAGEEATKSLIYGDKKRRSWAMHFPIWIGNYEGHDLKDIGDMTDAQIDHCVQDAKHWTEVL